MDYVKEVESEINKQKHTGRGRGAGGDGGARAKGPRDEGAKTSIQKNARSSSEDRA